MSKSPKKRSHTPRVTVYTSYRFLDKDPIVDAMRTIIQDEGMKHTDIHANGGATAGTLNNWFYGSTRRPQFATIAATARALGYEVQLVKPTKLHGTPDNPYVPIVRQDGMNGHSKFKVSKPKHFEKTDTVRARKSARRVAAMSAALAS